MEIWGVYTVSYETSEVLAARIPITLFFSIAAFIISVPFGILFGVISAVNRGKPLDTVVTLIANVTACLPQFWFALLIMFVFAMKLGWLPSYGFDWPWINAAGWKQMIMPLFCLSLGGIASTTRQTRSSMLEVIRQDYIRTARSKGIANNKVIYLHALKKCSDSCYYDPWNASWKPDRRFYVCGICF
mgnify:CR=1 FL=1